MATQSQTWFVAVRGGTQSAPDVYYVLEGEADQGPTRLKLKEAGFELIPDYERTPGRAPDAVEVSLLYEVMNTRPFPHETYLGNVRSSNEKYCLRGATREANIAALESVGFVGKRMV